MIERVAILGAGSLGAVYAKIFQEAGITTRLVAKGKRFERLQHNGFYINETLYHVPVLDADETHSNYKADLIIVATKYHQLASALPDLANIVGPNTIFISLLNGLTSEDIIGEMYGKEKVLLSDTVQEALRKANISYETPEDMQRMMWWKFMVNVGMNQSSAVSGATFGRYKSEPELRWLKENLMREVIAIAQAEGIDLKDEDTMSFYKTLDIIAEDGKTSMLQDIEAGRKTEVEMFAPVVIEFGEKHNIPTPINRTILSVIRTLEESPRRID